MRCDSPPDAGLQRTSYGIASLGCQAICSASGSPTTYAIAFPSGDQTGLMYCAGFVVIARDSPPLALITRTYPPDSSSVHVVYAIDWPSGDQVGAYSPMFAFVSRFGA